MNNPYQDGYDAFNKRLPQSANPCKDDAQKKLWDEGWEDAKMDADLSRRSICSEHEADPL